MASRQPISIPRIYHFPLRSAMDRSTLHVLSHIWIHCGYWHLYQVLGVNWHILAFILEMNVVWLCMLSHFSCGRLFAIPWTVTNQAPLSIRFSRQEHWSGLRCLPSGNLPYPGIEPPSLMSPALTGRFFKGLQTQGPRQTISFPTLYEIFVPPL